VLIVVFLLALAANCPASGYIVPARQACWQFVPHPDETALVVKSLDALSQAYCSGKSKRFLRLVAPDYELGRRQLGQSFRHAHRERRDFKLQYRIVNLRAFQRTIDVALQWTMSYRLRANDVLVQEMGLTHLALDRCNCCSLVSQKGTILFGGF